MSGITWAALQLIHHSNVYAQYWMCGSCRVIRRIAVPTAMSKALPKDTIQYGCEIASASVTPTGSSSQRHRVCLGIHAARAHP